MGFLVNILTILGAIAIQLLTSSSATSVNAPEFSASLQSFNQDLFGEFIQSSNRKSFIYSPLSIQTCLTMSRMGAAGQTAVEMDHGLGFTGQTPESVADNYFSLLAKYKDSNILKIANKLYVKKGYELQGSYKELVANKFFSSAENIDFSQKEKAANAINTWIETKTNNAIKELVKPDSLDNDVGMLLMSAIHFNGKWAAAFPKEDTREQEFYLNDGEDYNITYVQMMHRKGNFLFGRDRNMMADILILPYKDSDLSMVLFRPMLSFPKLVESLKNFQFQSLKNNAVIKDINADLYVPKFKTEFEVKLNDVLMKMGMKKMFQDADFGKMLNSAQGLSVSEVIHKATIEVSEEGTVAAAVTVVGKSLRNSRTISFNRAFAYAIINEDNVPLFQGTFTGR